MDATSLLTNTACADPMLKAGGGRDDYAGFPLRENGQDLAIRESGLLHPELPQRHWEKILLLRAMFIRGDYPCLKLDADLSDGGHVTSSSSKRNASAPGGTN